jgi:hypothetical protein
VERGGLAPLYGLSRTTKSPSQPKISSTPTPEHHSLLQKKELSSWDFLSSSRMTGKPEAIGSSD